MAKVYCKKCKWLREEYIAIGTTLPILKKKSYACKHSENMVLLKGGEWYEERKETVPNNSPQYINEKNDCKWYKGKK